MLCSFTYKKDEPFGKLFDDWKASNGSIDAHEAIVAALDGADSTKYGAFKTGSVASKYDYRSQVIKKNLKFQVLMLYALHEVEAADRIDPVKVTRAQVEQNAVRCPDPEKAEEMFKAIDDARRDQDSLGGVVACVVRGVPPGLGEPVFSKLEAELAKAMLSLPAVKGFEIGSGFAGTRMTGSQHNDPFRMKDGSVGTTTNHSGGVQGGISNGEPLFFRVAFKPTATIGKVQQTVNEQGEDCELEARGRHDPCVLPRAVPIVEAMTCLVLVDAFLIQRSRG